MPIKKYNIGVLNDQQLLELVEDNYITNFPINYKENNEIEDIDGSSLDLHISDEIWEVKSTAKLENRQTVKQLLKKQNAKKININDKLIKNHVYIIKLREEINFCNYKGKYGLHGRTSGRSSIGRIDILTRLIVDYCPKYDEIPPDYQGSLYIEVIPLSFGIYLEINCKLNQLRVFSGNPILSKLTSDELANLAPMLYYDKGTPILSEYDILRINLKPDLTTKINKKYHPIAYRAKTRRPLEISRPNEYYKPETYWDPVYKNNNSSYLTLKSGSFYILRSLERMFLPNDIAVVCVAYTENLGELRIHYAGFAHPNFGHHKNSKKRGAPLIFEVRCYSFDVTIKNCEHFARIEYYHMSEPTEHPSGYSNQELKLSNYFKKWQ